MKNVQVSEQYIREAIPHLVGDQASELARVVNQIVASGYRYR